MVGPDVQVGTHRRREVSLVAVVEADVRRQIQPIADAGFVVQPRGDAGDRADGRRRSCNDLAAGIDDGLRRADGARDLRGDRP